MYLFKIICLILLDDFPHCNFVLWQLNSDLHWKCPSPSIKPCVSWSWVWMALLSQRQGALPSVCRHSSLHLCIYLYSQSLKLYFRLRFKLQRGQPSLPCSPCISIPVLATPYLSHPPAVLSVRVVLPSPSVTQTAADCQEYGEFSEGCFQWLVCLVAAQPAGVAGGGTGWAWDGEVENWALCFFFSFTFQPGQLLVSGPWLHV